VLHQTEEVNVMSKPVNVTVWNEFRHERRSAEIAAVYPDGIHGAIAAHLRGRGMAVRTATLDEPEHGLTDAALQETDVLIWWGHMAHAEVDDEIVARVWDRVVLGGMGLIALHSAHFSKIFKKLMGTTCALLWREAAEKERVWVVEPGHPIAEGLGRYFEIPHCEMYGERFDIPAPDTLVLVSWFQGGEVFRSGCCYHRGNGKVFYFRPGHETFPIFFNPDVLQVITNAVQWAAPVAGPPYQPCVNSDPLEPLPVT
jgi:trehalose utilization protein